MQAKQTTMALLICSLFVSGSVLAGGGHGPSRGGPDVEIDDSFNHTDRNSHNLTFDKSDNDSFNDTDSYNDTNTDNDGFDLDWSNDQDWSLDVDIDTDINLMVAKSKIKGKLENVSVSYSSGGSMSKPKHHRGGRRGGNDCCGGLTVKNTNSLDGFQNAAGITSVAQNVGGNALAQQSVSINAK